MPRFEAALLAAVAAHRQALRQEIARSASAFSMRFLLARLGVPAEALDAVAGAADASNLAPALRADIARRLSAEAARLVRLARGASPAYDVNRHIAVRQAVAWMGGTSPDEGPAAGTIGDRLPGKVLNGRFRRPRHRRARRETAAPVASAARP